MTATPRGPSALRRVTPSLLLVAAIALAACARPSSEAGADVAAAEAAPAASPETAAGGAMEAAPAPPSPGTDPSQLASAANSQSDPARKFIRTADLRFRVEDVYRSALAIEDLVAAHGGFVVSNRIRSEPRDVRRRAIGDGRLLELTEVQTTGDLTVRVPAARTQPFLRALAKEMTFLDARDFGAHDAQFDLLRQQLAFRRGESLQQALGDAVEDGDRLDRKADAHAARGAALAARDEALVAQREFEDRVAFATVSLAMQQPPQLRRMELPDTAAALERHRTPFLPRVAQALASGWRVFLDVLVGLVALWPLWLVVAAAWLAWWRVRAYRRSPPP